jgi:signal transduction histidine kinase
MMNKKSVIKEESYRNFKNLSHELKNPVANLNLVLETLYEYDKTISIDKKKEILQLGLSEIKRLQDLIYIIFQKLTLRLYLKETIINNYRI